MKYFIIAGEASGDLHASNLMRELKANDPQAQFCFLGGDLMQAQGGSMVKHYRDMAFMGIITVLRNLRTVLRNLKDCKKSILHFQPDVVILIDYPSFNLRIARFVKEQLHETPVYYYISPKIWAWKEFRIKSIKKYVDKMFTILPFETEFYKKHHYQATYVGNPTVDSVAFRENKNETFSHFIENNKLDSRPIIALLSGSRKQEIKGCLQRMLEMTAYYPQYQFVVAAAPSIEPEFYEKLTTNFSVNILYGKTYDLLQQAHAAIVNSGTATLETALFRVPQVVVYQVFGGILANILKPIVLKVKYVSLVNLIAKHELVKELIAHQFSVTNLKTELDKILLNKEKYREITNGYDQIIQILGKPGAANHAAKAIINELKSNKKQN